MKRRKDTFTPWFYWAVITGHALFIFWILNKGIPEQFHDAIPEDVSVIGLSGLLIIDRFLP